MTSPAGCSRCCRRASTRIAVRDAGLRGRARRAGARVAATTRSSPRCSGCSTAEQLTPEQTVFVSGIGCSSRFPHYLQDLRLPRHPRPRAAGGHRHQAAPPRAQRLRGDGRRRLHLDRRRPLDPRAALQRGHDRADARQRDLRADQEPDLADHAAGLPSNTQPHGSYLPAAQPDRGRAGRDQRLVRGPDRRVGARAHVRDAAGGLPAPRASASCASSSAARSIRAAIFQSAVQDPARIAAAGARRRRGRPGTGRRSTSAGGSTTRTISTRRAAWPSATESHPARGASSRTHRGPATTRPAGCRRSTADERVALLDAEFDRYAV